MCTLLGFLSFCIYSTIQLTKIPILPLLFHTKIPLIENPLPFLIYKNTTPKIPIINNNNNINININSRIIISIIIINIIIL